MAKTVIDNLYERAVSLGYKKDIDQFKDLVNKDQEVFNDMYKYAADSGLVKNENEFAIAVSPVEKKSLFESPIIGDQQEPPAKGGVSKPAPGSSVSQGTSVFSKPIIEQPAPQVPGPVVEEEEPIKPKPKPKPVSYVPEYKKTEVGKLISQEPVVKEEVYTEGEAPSYGRKENKYFTGKLGDVLDAIDTNPIGSAIADFVDDVGRAVGTGLNNAGIVTPSNQMMISGPKTDRETIVKYIKAVKESQGATPSDEMVRFYNMYEANGKDLVAFMKSLASNPGAVPELIIS